MSSVDLVVRAVERRGPERVPNGCYSLPASIQKYGARLTDLLRSHPSDFHQFVASWGTLAGDSIPYREGINTDPWGVTWRNTSPGIYGRIVEHPLADLDKLEDYVPPEPSQLVDFDQVERSIRESGHSRYVLGDSENFFERLHFLHGFERTLIDLVRSDARLIRLMDALLEFKIRFIKRWLEVDIDGVYFLDDWGTMQGLMISPTLWRRVFKPLYGEMFNLVHRAGKHVFFHSDGYVMEIIPDLIEIGVDALNIQVRLLGVEALGSKFSDRVCFLADVDRQNILPFGSKADVAEHVKEIVDSLGSNSGGLISWGEIGPDVPLANVEAMLESFEKYGTYRT